MSTPYAGMNRIRLKGRCGVTHPLSPLARTPLDEQIFDYEKYSDSERELQIRGCALGFLAFHGGSEILLTIKTGMTSKVKRKWKPKLNCARYHSSI